MNVLSMNVNKGWMYEYRNVNKGWMYECMNIGATIEKRTNWKHLPNCRWELTYIVDILILRIL